VRISPLTRGRSVPVQLLTSAGVQVLGAVWLQRDVHSERLVFCVPPGGTVVGVEGLGRHGFYSRPHKVQEQVMSDFIERMRRTCAKTVDGESPADEDFVERFPGIHEFLGRSKLADGSARTRSKLTLFYEGAAVKLGLTEPDMEMSAFVTSDGVFAGLQCLEEAIQGDKLDWRRWYGNGKHRGNSKRA
jgi:hypothetical protein